MAGLIIIELSIFKNLLHYLRYMLSQKLNRLPFKVLFRSKKVSLKLLRIWNHMLSFNNNNEICSYTYGATYSLFSGTFTSSDYTFTKTTLTTETIPIGSKTSKFSLRRNLRILDKIKLNLTHLCWHAKCNADPIHQCEQEKF